MGGISFYVIRIQTGRQMTFRNPDVDRGEIITPLNAIYRFMNKPFSLGILLVNESLYL
jgi:hypothetical protein